MRLSSSAKPGYERSSPKPPPFAATGGRSDSGPGVADSAADLLQQAAGVAGRLGEREQGLEGHRQRHRPRRVGARADLDRDGDALLAASSRDPDPEGRRAGLLARGDRHEGPQHTAPRVERGATTVEEGPGGAQASPGAEPDDEHAAGESARGVDLDRHAPDVPDDVLRPGLARQREQQRSREQGGSRARQRQDTAELARAHAPSTLASAASSSGSSSSATVRRSSTRRPSTTRAITGGRFALSNAAM